MAQADRIETLAPYSGDLSRPPEPASPDWPVVGTRVDPPDLDPYQMPRRLLEEKIRRLEEAIEQRKEHSPVTEAQADQIILLLSSIDRRMATF